MARINTCKFKKKATKETVNWKKMINTVSFLIQFNSIILRDMLHSCIQHN